MNKVERIPTRFQPALERLDGDLELLCEMAAITCEDLPGVKQSTETALEEGDCEKAASGLHKLKGMLSTFESDGVALDLQDALDAARKEKTELARVYYDENRAAIESLHDGIQRLAAGLSF